MVSLTVLSNPSHRVVTAPFRELDDDLLDGLVIVFGIYAVCGSPFLGRAELGGVNVNGEDAGSSCLLCSLSR